MHLLIDSSVCDLASPVCFAVTKSGGTNSARLGFDIVVCASRAGNAGMTIPDGFVIWAHLTVSSLRVDIGCVFMAMADLSSSIPDGTGSAGNAAGSLGRPVVGMIALDASLVGNIVVRVVTGTAALV